MRPIQILIVFCTLFSCSYCTSPDIEQSFSQDLAIDSNVHCTEINYEPNHYDSMCQCIEEYDVIFPTKNAVSGKIFKNSAQLGEEFKTESVTDLDIEFIESLRKITEDSSNFIWGEAGTPYEDYRLEFYNSEGVFINSAIISLDGMLWVTPYLGTTKWGGLSLKGDASLRELINKSVDD